MSAGGNDIVGRHLAAFTEKSPYDDFLNLFRDEHRNFIRGTSLRDQYLTQHNLPVCDLLESYKSNPNRPLGEYLRKFNQKLNVIMGLYQTILNNLKGINQNIQLIIHGYDHIIPILEMGSSIPSRSGWVGARLKYKGFPETLWKGMVKLMIDNFNDRLEQFQKQNSHHVHYINLRGKIKGWKDEMHPSDTYCKEIAPLFKQKINQINQANVYV